MEILSSGAYLPDHTLERAQRAAGAARAAAHGTGSAPSGTARPTLANTARPASKGVDRASKLYKVSVEFEAILIKQMLNAMRKSVPKSGFVDGGMAEEFFEDMLYDEYAKSMASTAGFGLAEMIVRQLSP
jgi:hypothetical protein